MADMISLKGMSVGGYGRISEDRLDLRGGVDRQRDDMVSMVERLGGNPDSIKWFIENDTSAFKKRRVTRTDVNGNTYDAYRVIRPVWHNALHALRTGEIEVLVVWDLDRLARDMRDLEDAIEVVQYTHGRHVLSATASGIDLTTDAGIAMARVLMSMNAKQSADTARRVKREHRAAAEAGIPRGGQRPFGYEDDKRTIRESEARYIREAVAGLIAGRTINSILREWQSAGVKSPRGYEWRSGSLRTMLLNPRNAGWRASKREIVMKGGERVRGQWEPIIDQDSYEKLVAALTDRTLRKSRTGVRKYMLSGILRCGVCREGMVGNYRQSTGTFGYRCMAGSKGVIGHSVNASGPAVDAIVRAQVGLRVVGGIAPSGDVPPFDGDERIAELEAEIKQTMADIRANPKMRGILFPHAEALEEERAQLAESRSQWIANTLGTAHADVTAEEWAEMTPDEVRAHCFRHLHAIVVMPATKHSPRFDADRLEYVWK